MRPFVLYTRCLWTCRRVFVMSTWYEILVDFISSCRESGKMNAMLFIFSRLCSPRGAGLIPSWMTPTFWFTVTFPVLFTEKGMAICFPRWVLVDLTLWMLWSLKLIFALLCSWKYQGVSPSKILEYWLECCIHTERHLYDSSNYLTCVNSTFFYYWTKLWLWKCSLMCSCILILCEKPLWDLTGKRY